MKLNLGCGKDKKQGYINVDVRANVQPERVHNLECIPYPFLSESAEEIVAKDVLEHFPYDKVEGILREWVRIMAKGATIYVQTPNLVAIAEIILKDSKRTWKDLSYWIYGGQDYSDNFHKAGFTIPEMQKLLEEVGLKVTKIHGNSGTNLMCWAHKP